MLSCHPGDAPSHQRGMLGEVFVCGRLSSGAERWSLRPADWCCGSGVTITAPLAPASASLPECTLRGPINESSAYAGTLPHEMLHNNTAYDWIPYVGSQFNKDIADVSAPPARGPRASVWRPARPSRPIPLERHG